MCGFVGQALSRDMVDRELLARQAQMLAHRGPDAAGEWYSPNGAVGLAHRRLAILDLSSAGTQPMCDQSGDLHAVLNGEIYNFAELRNELRELGRKFRTGTDTEVLLAAYAQWGDACVGRLRGMFAFVIHDSTRNRLFCARDRAGEKPFFYRFDTRGFHFASELKALLIDPEHPRRIDSGALDAYFAYGFVPGGDCMLHGFEKLPPAHWLALDLTTGRVTVQRYWSLPQHQDVGASASSLVDALDQLLMAAVTEQLVADVPVGILLSGGIDSSLIAAAAVANGRQVRTFTATFPKQPSYDEGPAARLIARALGTEHVELSVAPAEPSLLAMLAAQYDEPIADSSMIPTYLISRAIREHATVALGGDGGDELFGGYLHYRWLHKQTQILRLVPAVARQAASSFGRRMPIGAHGRNHLIATAGNAADRIAHVNLYYDAATRARLLGPAGVPSSAERLKRELCDAEPPSRAAARVDFLTYLPDDLLVKADRASMAASLELRAPFLDHRIVEFAFARVPESHKLGRHDNKLILRRLAKRHLPHDVVGRRKQGFSVPLGDWLRGPWGRQLYGVLADAPTDIFDREFVSDVWQAQQRGFNNTQRLFALMMFELWRRTYNVRDLA